MSKERKNIISGLLFVILGLGLLVLIIPNAIADIEIKYAGPKDFPIFISACMIFLGGVLAAQNLFKELKQKKTTISLSAKIDIKSTIRLIAFVVTVFAYIFAANIIGYLIATILVSVILLLLLKEKNKYYYFLTIAVVVALYLMFTQLLFVELP